MNIPVAAGASITGQCLEKKKSFLITDFGAEAGGNPSENTRAVNRAIEEAYAQEGGTVVIPQGEYKVYTIRLKSHVNLQFEKGAVLRAARTDIRHSYQKQEGEGGNYEEPEINRYAGLQDHGHSYFANSLIYGADLEDIMIYGEGLIDGSCYENGYRSYVLLGGDPFEPLMRNANGHNGEWFGNKAIALVRCKNVVLKDFSIVIGGHFAILATAVENLLVEDLLIDTTRDALDVDCCQNVTVRNSVFNSLTDDALVLKASYGAGIFMPVKNVLIEDCTVSGYDAGSVYAGTYTREKLAATDRCGPTGRVKLGTESTCGYDMVTIRRVTFDRSRGFALEAVDGSDLSNILFTDCTMDNVSSSPVFIRAGDRGRFPVTGNSTEELLHAADHNVRLDNRNWILPKLDSYQEYPARRYTPSYRKDYRVSIDGNSEFAIVNQEEPAYHNPVNSKEETKAEEWQYPYYANANGSSRMAKVHDIEIRNLTVTNADPRYPILIMGLADSKIERVTLKNIKVEYRGGIKMEHAVEQRQLNTNWRYTQYETTPSVQSIPWLVNTFFLKEEGLLPRADWNQEKQCFVENPYNIPELANVYPEPSNWGILPAYGLYARHVEGLCVENAEFSWKTEDERHVMVFDHAKDVRISAVKADCKDGIEPIAAVKSFFRRPTNREYILHEPYRITEVTNLSVPQEWKIKQVEIHAPAPGTPQDEYYAYPTIPAPEYGYSFRIPTGEYPLPLTVHRPFLAQPGKVTALAGQKLQLPIQVRHPACEVAEEETEGFIYNETVTKKEYGVSGQDITLHIETGELPPGAVFLKETCEIIWTPKKDQIGEHKIILYADDTVIKEEMRLRILVTEES